VEVDEITVVNAHKSVGIQQVFVFLQVLADDDLPAALQINVGIGAAGFTHDNLLHVDKLQAVGGRQTDFSHAPFRHVGQQNLQLPASGALIPLLFCFGDSPLKFFQVNRFQQIVD